jgi:Ca2+-binding RTX toxin-like protein
MANVYGTDNPEMISTSQGVTNGPDFIFALGGNDRIFGVGGDDYIKGGGGADTIDGGGGNDTASYFDSDTSVIVNLATGRGFGGYANDDRLIDIENLIGSTHSDLLVGNDVENILNGHAGNDTIRGGGGLDTLFGGQGNDRLDGGTGNDTTFGGIGDDRHYVDSTGDDVTENDGEGNDTVFSSAVLYTLSSFVETLSLDTDTDTGVFGIGNAQGNTIFGNINDNVLDGGAGSDSLSGLGGNDTFVFHAGQAHGDVVYEFNGNGAAAGDVLRFEGYGTLAEGATFHQLTATEWQINSADGTIHEIITLTAGAVIDTTTDIMFV